MAGKDEPRARGPRLLEQAAHLIEILPVHFPAQHLGQVDLERLRPGPREVSGAGMIERVASDLVAVCDSLLPSLLTRFRARRDESEGRLDAVPVQDRQAHVDLGQASVIEAEAHGRTRPVRPREGRDVWA